MSTLHHDTLFETCNEQVDIRPCFNGVGSWEVFDDTGTVHDTYDTCLLYTSPSPRDRTRSRMPSSA